MKKHLFAALLIFALCLPTASAMSFPGLAKTYILVD
jgi:hypothetical protein